MKPKALSSWKRVIYRAGLINLLAAFLAVLLNYRVIPASAGGPPSGIVFSDPFGYLGYSLYQPRYTYDINHNLIENTDFDVKNPDLSRPTSCFGVPMNQLWHAGEDEYRISGSTFGADVRAIADGVVKYAAYLNYPGSVVIIEHGNSTPIIYSVYSHLEPTSVHLSNGEYVTQGQILGYVMHQDYDGLYPAYHSPDDSHLHFEIRYFLDASQIYTNYPNCNGIMQGGVIPILNTLLHSRTLAYITLTQPIIFYLISGTFRAL